MHEMTQHTGEMPFAWSKCDKAFTDRSSLRYHERVRLEEKPFAYYKSDKAFTDTSGLRKHEKIQTGEKPFAC